MKNIFPILLIVLTFSLLCFANEKEIHELSNSKYRIAIDGHLNASLFIHNTNWQLISSASPFYYLIDINGKQVNDFNVVKCVTKNNADAVYGKSKSIEITAICSSLNIELNFVISLPEKITGSIVCTSSIKNLSNSEINLGGYAISSFLLNAKDFSADSSYKFWSFQGASYEGRFDWILPLTSDFKRDNFQGMNADDYGGGMPVVDLWTKQQGIAFASLSKVQELISLPVKVIADSGVSFKILSNQDIKLAPKEVYKNVPFAIIFHNGDYFNGLQTYAELLRADNFKTYTSPKSAFQTEWCAWGYGRKFIPSDILNSLDLVKKLGINWVTIDDGWQNNLGDWELDKDKFPDGDKSMKALIDSIHAKGLKVRLWWAPLTAHDSIYSAKYYPSNMKEYGFNLNTKIGAEHPDWFLLDKDGKRVKVSWWNSYYLCPANKGVVDYFKTFVKRAIVKWGVDGFKIDGQNFNMAPECFNKTHNHKNAIASMRAVPEYFRQINDVALKLNPNFVIQLCPCGTNFSIYNLPYVNQLVASDPESPWQIRLRGKAYRALLGNKVAYSGDHVELTNHIWHDELKEYVPTGDEDFVSTMGVGGVPSTKFTISGIPQADSSLILTPAKQDYYEKWIGIYNNEKMSEGKYLNLYDIAYDKPETHLIKKGGAYYYSFFSKGQYDGKAELKGLEKGNYNVYDLFTGKLLSNIDSSNPFLNIKFNQFVMLKVIRGNN